MNRPLGCRFSYFHKRQVLIAPESLALEVLFVTKQELVMLATMLSRELGIEGMLARSNATRHVYFVACR
jgi:hypothetical protein